MLLDKCGAAAFDMNLLCLKTLAFLLFVPLLVSCATTSQANSTVGSRAFKEQVFVTSQKQPLAKGDAMGQLLHQGRQRSYYLHTPKSYNPKYPMPLVLAFHGYGSQGKDLAANTGFNQLAEQEGFIIAYPNGIEQRWNVASGLLGVDDVSFVSVLIEHLSQIRAIDQSRIYAVGVSNGGFLVQRLACEAKSKFAAFASVVATLPGQLQAFCHPTSPVSMLMINGTDDRKVPWAGGKFFDGWFLSVPDTIDFWRQQNGCSAKTQVKQLNRRVETTRYLDCQHGAEVELVTLLGAGHVWPRGGDGAKQLLNGSEKIWHFFQRHRLKIPG